MKLDDFMNMANESGGDASMPSFVPDVPGMGSVTKLLLMLTKAEANNGRKYVGSLFGMSHPVAGFMGDDGHPRIVVMLGEGEAFDTRSKSEIGSLIDEMFEVEGGIEFAAKMAVLSMNGGEPKFPIWETVEVFEVEDGAGYGFKMMLASEVD